KLVDRGQTDFALPANEVLALANKRSIVPEDRHPSKGVASDRYPPDGWERQVGCHQQLAGSRHFPQKAGADADCLLGIMFESVVPVRVVESDCEHRVAGKRQCLATGRQADYAMPGGVTTRAADDHPRSHFVLVLEWPQVASVLFNKLPS